MANTQLIEKKIPAKIRLGIFEIGLSNIKSELLAKVSSISEQFKTILPVMVEERTKYLNKWLEGYNEVIKE